MKVLILGGTGNIGPYFVQAALDAGHQVAVFSRGKERIDLPRPVERLIGDRNGDLEAIKNRAWDAVIDVATFAPDWVKSLGEAISRRTGQYLFISTVSVYDHPELNDRTLETSQVLESAVRPIDNYGANKVLAEREAERQFPGKTVILRPGYIVGPGDRIGFLTFWPLRMEWGGEVMIPGDPLLPFQCIDVRDLAEFAVRMLEKRTTGVFNAVGPAAPATLGQMFETARAVTSSSAKAAWVPAARIAAQPDPAVWRKPMFWSWYSDTMGQANIMRMGNDRALAAGLSFRSLSATLADSIAWYRQQPATVQTAFAPGYPYDRDGVEPPSLEVLWRTYLQREREVLNGWRGEQAGKTRAS